MRCPDCGTATNRVHAYDERIVADSRRSRPHHKHRGKPAGHAAGRLFDQRSLSWPYRHQASASSPVAARSLKNLQPGWTCRRPAA